MNQSRDFSDVRTKIVAGALGLLGGLGAATAVEYFTALPSQFVPVFAAGGAAVSLFSLRRAFWTEEQLSASDLVEALDRHSLVSIADRNAIFVSVNEHLARTVGYTSAELIGKPASFLYEPTVGMPTKAIHATLARAETWHGETTLRHKDGHPVITRATIRPRFDRRGRFAGSVSVRTDVSDSKRRSADAYSAAILDGLRDPILVFDGDSRVLSYANTAARDLFGVLAAQGERDLSERMHAVLGDSAIPILEVIADRSPGAPSSTLNTQSRDGMQFETKLQVIASDGVPDRLILVMNDVTEQATREEAQSQFISTVSHELRSPLTSIKGAMGLVLSKAAGHLPEKAEGLLRIAHRNADRLVLIINDLLDIEKIAAGQMEMDIQETDITRIVTEAIEASAVNVERFDLSLTTEGLDRPVRIETDENRTLQVLFNLLSNAGKFSRAGGRVLVRLDEDVEAVTVSVVDEGDGIAIEDQGKVFQRFADLANSKRAANGGSGLGLNICKAIVERLGGSIGFESAEGVGSRFHFTLPRRQAAPEEDTSVAAEDRERSVGTA